MAAHRAQLDLMTSADRVPGALTEVRDRRGRSVTITSGTAELGTDRAMVDGDGRDITVRQLLQHASGLPDYVRFVNLAEQNRPAEAAELVRIALPFVQRQVRRVRAFLVLGQGAANGRSMMPVACDQTQRHMPLALV